MKGDFGVERGLAGAVPGVTGSVGSNGTVGSAGRGSPTDRLAEDLRLLQRDANAVVSDLAEATATGVRKASSAMAEKAAAGRDRVQGYVTEHPWRVLGVVAGLSLAVGWLLNRR